MVPNRIEFENYHSILGVFKLTGIILPRTAKTELPRMAVVPNRNDVLKQNACKALKLVVWF
ncbi:hypothetical protein DWQ65_10665 [Treponema phagedenis]|uniref:Uncharacterized protein n=1 Tax=Treponema phagedenis TaxID=162 RepID=A0AAE6IWD2_TREPH|nr:hypothetical protein FUT79_13890 [Treponema phagedenis]QEJ99396.1 hypothetical protein FUT82_16315 [Treponema phagedenis]QEJ99882.1 hypothetical protein FUT84_00950 [Treponema phagedenis]QEK04967.1 hypothetical protein FUT83_14965 [Treponema phagedenis]QEK07415.1 hypothetical protein FUT80_12260 [Treponema phagedenis]